ncbi:MAG: DUF3943 domain-containing protein [Betaproteobacteria bacterium]|nr:MAG: DUF3943 domain-containing protein [Betaproteobacteria bacterium]
MHFRSALLGIAFALGATIACAALAAEPDPTYFPALWAALQNDPLQPIPGEARPDFSEDIATRKSYAIPAFEIVGFDVLLNLSNRHFIGSPYHSNLTSIRHNLHHSWVVDNDPFSTNQFGHPYQGSMYHGFARSAGLNFWESLGYTFAGSAFWEIAGETTPPSRNDQIASGIAGSFFGEALFRMANLLLERGDPVPSLWREVGAAIISPPTGFNRLAFGERFRTIFPSHDPVYYSRLALGVSATTQNEPGTSTKLRRNEAQVDFSMDYGLPGKPDYTYKRPFDYFTVQVTGSSANGFENILTRGLLYGRDYGFGANYRGIWGLYGSYDYIAPQVFRVSSTALSLGTTGQWWLSDAIALQGSVLFGTGYAGVGTIHGTSATDYHYGVAPQALAALRLIFGETASLDLLGREYFVSRLGAASTGGHDNILRADTAFTVRIYRQHAIALKYIWSRRDATFPDLGNASQTRGTIGIFYTYLGHDRFGAVDWR